VFDGDIHSKVLPFVPPQQEEISVAGASLTALFFAQGDA
jgi:hypothetical protein